MTKTSWFHDRTRLEVIRTRLEVMGGAMVRIKSRGGSVKYQTCLIFCRSTMTSMETTTDPIQVCKTEDPPPIKFVTNIHYQCSPTCVLYNCKDMLYDQKDCTWKCIIGAVGRYNTNSGTGA